MIDNPPLLVERRLEPILFLATSTGELWSKSTANRTCRPESQAVPSVFRYRVKTAHHVRVAHRYTTRPTYSRPMRVKFF